MFRWYCRRIRDNYLVQVPGINSGPERGINQWVSTGWEHWNNYSGMLCNTFREILLADAASSCHNPVHVESSTLDPAATLGRGSVTTREEALWQKETTRRIHRGQQFYSTRDTLSESRLRSCAWEVRWPSPHDLRSLRCVRSGCSSCANLRVACSTWRSTGSCWPPWSVAPPWRSRGSGPPHRWCRTDLEQKRISVYLACQWVGTFKMYYTEAVQHRYVK